MKIVHFQFHSSPTNYAEFNALDDTSILGIVHMYNNVYVHGI